MSGQLGLRRRVAFSLVLVALVLVAVEGICQLFYRLSAGDFLFRRTGAPIFEADPTRCYRLKPNLAYEHRTNEFEIPIYTNPQGLRTDSARGEVTAEKPAGVYRVLFLGPSFTFGWGSSFEEAYATRIGELLRTTGRRIEIMNLGTPAQGVESQLCWLEKEGPGFQPDMVVQTVYGQRMPSVVGACPERLDCPVIENGTLYSVPPTLGRKLIAQLKNSGLVFYAYYVYQWALGIAPSGESGTGKEFHGARAAAPAGADPQALEDDFARYERTIDRVLGDRVEVVFLFIPMSFVVHPADAARWSHLLEADPLGSRERIRADVEALRAKGHVIIDTTAALVERGERDRLYYWLDIHLNPLGNRVVAEAALPTLLERIARSAPESPSAPATNAAISSARRSLPASNR